MVPNNCDLTRDRCRYRYAIVNFTGTKLKPEKCINTSPAPKTAGEVFIHFSGAGEAGEVFSYTRAALILLHIFNVTHVLITHKSS